MKAFRFFWDTHKWVGIAASLLVLLVTSTGFLLLVKKDFAWIQPPTQRGTERPLEQWLNMQELWEVVAARKHPSFRSLADIDRVDVRIGRALYKVRSKLDHSELQIDATAGKVLSDATRNSDWIEALHDGSLLGAWAHDYLMPAFAFSLLYLTFSGMWLWLAPILKRHRKRRRRAKHA